MKKINLCSAALIGAMGLFSNVSANEVGVNFQLTGTSDYVLRGVSQTSDKAAVFGDVAKNGWTWTLISETLEQWLQFYLNTNFGDYLNTFLIKPKSQFYLR